LFVEVNDAHTLFLQPHKEHSMAPLSKFILTYYRRTQSNDDLAEERRG
jgi:hypothetical protein